jgi:sugar lactone lactonase YvrE
VDVIAAGGAEILRRPAGMAVDDEGGLWIVEFRAHRLRYYDPVLGILEPADTAGSRAAGLYLPYGICRGANGQKVVADWGNHRVVAIERSGSIRVLCDSFGSEPGQLRHPIAVVPAHNGDGFWVVDQRNHRLQFMDADGAFVSQIGRCGPGKNELVLPEYVTPLPNGLLLVSQWRTRKEIKLFSLDGREQDRLAVDYAPSGMLVRGKFLWVADFQGSDVRVYELS